LGFRYASDTRGTGPFLPLSAEGGGVVPQLPTTLPTFDELIGRDDLSGADPVQHLLCGWQQRGMNLADLATYAGQLHLKSLPRCAIVACTVAGRSGTLALQGP